MTTSHWTVGPWRALRFDGVPVVLISRAEGTSTERADALAHAVARLFNKVGATPGSILAAGIDNPEDVFRDIGY